MYVHRIYAKCKRAHQQHIAIAHMPMSRRTYAPYKVYVFAIIVLYYCTATAKKLHKKVSLTLLRSEREREREKSTERTEQKWEKKSESKAYRNSHTTRHTHNSEQPKRIAQIISHIWAHNFQLLHCINAIHVYMSLCVCVCVCVYYYKMSIMRENIVGHNSQRKSKIRRIGFFPFRGWLSVLVLASKLYIRWSVEARSLFRSIFILRVCSAQEWQVFSEFFIACHNEQSLWFIS